MAMARDRGIVFHTFFSRIQRGLNIPVRTILFCYVFNVCFGLLYLGPTVAFSAYVASCTIFLDISYAFPIVILLVRGRGVLAQHQVGKTPFKMGKRLGLVVNVVAALYLIVTSVVSGHLGVAGVLQANPLNYSSSAFPPVYQSPAAT